jgi:membrane-associated protease RseP (regulator of RpoE activity)
MKTTAIAWASLVCGGLLASSAGAQPVLERVEKLLRQQVDAARRPAADAPSGYLGLVADDSQDAGTGVRVLQVLAGQPAAAAGVRVGDLITKIDGQAVRTMDEMARALAGKPAGTKVPLVVSRQGADQPIEVTLGTRPGATPGAAPGPAEELPAAARPAPDAAVPPEAAASREAAQPGERRQLGVRTVPVSETVRAQNKLPSSAGAQVISVIVGSPAERAQIPLGAIVTAVDGQAVDSPNALAAVIGRTTAPEVELKYVHRAQEVSKRVVLSPPRPGDEGPQLRARPPVVELPTEATPPPAIVLPVKPQAAQAPLQAVDNASLIRRLEELEARVKNLEAQLERRKPVPPQIRVPE